MPPRAHQMRDNHFRRQDKPTKPSATDPVLILSTHKLPPKSDLSAARCLSRSCSAVPQQEDETDWGLVHPIVVQYRGQQMSVHCSADMCCE